MSDTTLIDNETPINDTSLLSSDTSSRTIWVSGQPFGNAYINIKSDNTVEAPIGAEIFNDFENNIASGDYAHAEGKGTIANNEAEHAEGKYNKSNTNTIHSVGIGTSNTDRKNAIEVMQNGDVYINGIGTYDGTNIDTATSVQEVVEDAANAVQITYAELKSLRDAGKLVPGQQYRITDYTCTTTQTGTKSAGHVFDIIVTADSESVLNEEVRAIQHEGDAYFGECDLDAWKIWYCLDNDTTRFAWADVTNGKGVIYRMIDEFNNDCPYDFKNIQFYRKWDSTKSLWSTISSDNTGVPCYTFSYGGSSSSTSFTDMSLRSSNNIYSNIIKRYINSDNSNKQTLNNNCFFGDCCYSNTFGNNCDHNTFGDNCYSNSFGEGCSSNSFGINCYANSFGNSCYSNTFGNYDSYNSFGNQCNHITFENGVYRNSFGNGCYNFSLLGQSYNNSFGNECYDCSFGPYLNGNSFGNYCYNNRIGNGGQFNSFGNYCIGIRFGNVCHGNSLGNYCQDIKFLTDSVEYAYYRNNHFGDACKYITITGNETASTNEQVQNYKFAQGVQGTADEALTIDGKRNRSYETYISRDTDGTIKESVIGDCVDLTSEQTITGVKMFDGEYTSVKRLIFKCEYPDDIFSSSIGFDGPTYGDEYNTFIIGDDHGKRARLRIAAADDETFSPIDDTEVITLGYLRKTDAANKNYVDTQVKTVDDKAVTLDSRITQLEAKNIELPDYETFDDITKLSNLTAKKLLYVGESEVSIPMNVANLIEIQSSVLEVDFQDAVIKFTKPTVDWEQQFSLRALLRGHGRCRLKNVTIDTSEQDFTFINDHDANIAGGGIFHIQGFGYVDNCFIINGFDYVDNSFGFRSCDHLTNCKVGGFYAPAYPYSYCNYLIQCRVDNELGGGTFANCNFIFQCYVTGPGFDLSECSNIVTLIRVDSSGNIVETWSNDKLIVGGYDMTNMLKTISTVGGTGKTKLYAKPDDKSGIATVLLDTTPVSWAVARRTPKGTIKAKDAIEDDDLVTKKQFGTLEAKNTNAVQITYSELKSLRDTGNLVPGTQYRITDYTCTTTQANTKSAGHVFDIIVTADDASTLNEGARAVKHNGDTYFTNCDLNAWKIWYCLDNDTSRFVWADKKNGKGVIYRMIDEFNNDCPYDFKNIQFYRQWDATKSLWSTISSDNTGVPCYTFSSTGFISTTSFSDTSLSILNNVYSNVIKEYITEYGEDEITLAVAVQLLNNNCFFGGNCFSNSFGNNCSNNSFGHHCTYNVFGNNCYSNSIGNLCDSNAFGNSCSNNVFGNNCSYNSLGSGCQNIKFSVNITGRGTLYDYYQNNRFGDGCRYILFKGIATASITQQVQNYNFAQGLQGTDSTYLTINGVRGRSFETKVAKDSSGALKTYCEADLIL